MTVNQKFFFSFKKALAVYSFFTLCFFLPVIYSFWSEHIRPVLFESFLFYFSSELSEFKEWYPRYYLVVYLFIQIIKILFVALLIASIFAVVKQRKQILSLIYYNNARTLYHYLKAELILFFLFLGCCLGVYFGLKHFSDEHFFYRQLFATRIFLLTICLQLLIFFITRKETVINHFKQFLFKPTSPYNIATLRILFFLYLIFLYYILYVSTSNTLSLSEKTPLPYIGWLIDILPVNNTIYNCCVFAGIVCSLFIAIGLFTRFFLIVNAFLCFYIVATPNFFGKFEHDHIFIWISWFFTFSKCYDVLSLDSIIKKRAVKLSADYTFPVSLAWLQLGVIYFWAGFYKLWDSGFEWALGSSMINQVRLEWVQNYDVVPAIRIDNFPLFLHIGGLLVILFELSYPFLVLRPKTRWVAAISGLTMHNIIGYFMNISFFFMLQVVYVFFVDFSFLFRKKITHIASGFSKPTFLFCISILSLNFLCGLFSIDSYPFSSYPKYSALIGDRLKFLEYSCPALDKSIFEIGKKNGFRWESYGWLEHNLIYDFESGKDVAQRMISYWEIWKSHNKELQICDTVFLTIKERSLVPEEKNYVYSKKEIGFILNDDCFFHKKSYP